MNTSLLESVTTQKELPVNSKIEQIANQIISLNLIEVAQLSELLKKKLNLPDAMPMNSFVAGPVKAEVYIYIYYKIFYYKN